MTRREQVRELTLKLLGCTVPTATLVGAMFAIGGRPAAVATLVFGGLAAVALATSVRTVRAGVISGLLLAAGLVAMLAFFAYVRGA
jgi:small-conductance mechanosensitive channel